MFSICASSELQLRFGLFSLPSVSGAGLFGSGGGLAPPGSAMASLSSQFSNTSLAEGLGLVSLASNGMLNDPDLDEMRRELQALISELCRIKFIFIDTSALLIAGGPQGRGGSFCFGPE